MKRKKITALLTSLTLMVSMTACGGNDTSGTAPDAGGQTESGAENDAGDAGADAGSEGSGYTAKELTVNIWDNNQLDGLQKIADEWTEASGVKVRINVITWNEYWTLLEAGASGGEMPDVFWMHINEAEKYMSADMLLNMDTYIAADEAIDLSNYYEGIVDIYSKDGSQYALPKDHDTIALLYNKAIFDKYDVSYPTDAWTWDDYAAAAATIAEKGAADGIYGTAMNTNDGQDGWYNLIYGFGGELISEDKKTSGMDNENTLKAMKWLADELFPSMPDQDTMSTTDPDLLFQSGLVGMMLQGSWMVNTFYTAANASDYAWAQIPYYDANGNGSCDEGERVSLYNGLGWAVSKNTADPKAAYDLVSAFCSEEGQTRQAELGVTMSAYKGCSDAFTSAFEGMDLKPFLEVEENGTLIQHPYSRYTTRWEGMFTTDLVPAWKNPETMTDVCTNVANQMNEILAEE
ncbi:MAG: sugar ABC transporter substrate-binding protein [Eubacterium sp.]|nr:sugar ABC transporter substrate-binding protein [Eubacterium sp.]